MRVSFVTISMKEMDPSQKNKRNGRLVWLVAGGCLTMLACLSLLALGGVVGYLYYVERAEAIPLEMTVAVTREAVATRRAEAAVVTDPPPTPPLAESTPIPGASPLPTVTSAPVSTLDVPVEIDQRAVPARAWADLTTLYESDYPSHDYFDTAVRLGKQNLGSRTVTGPQFQRGDTHTFYNGDEHIDATLLAVTDHTYFWVEEGLNLDAAAVAGAADRFEEEYYPLLVTLFGDVWSPGVDGDPRLSILHVRNGTEDELGRFDSTNEFPRTLYAASNEQELIYMNMGALSLGSDLYFGTLVHEMQHLIQWHVDPSEALWVNEGLSQLAEIYVGLETADTEEYLLYPETRLNSWNFDDDHVYAHYAASFLFMVYFWEQLGETAVQEFSRHPANGMAGVRAVLQKYRPNLSVPQFVGDWAVANYLDDSTAAPQYGYRAFDFQRPEFAERVAEAPFETINEMAQFGVHYVNLNDLRGETTISFAGDTVVDLTDAAPISGEQMWFAPAVDEMNAHLTARFDLSGLEQATLHYAVWYDLEADYDYAYVSASTDGGESWELLVPEHTTVGAFGPAYNGRSADVSDALNGWIKEAVSLNAYVGQMVMIRFDVLTDSDITARGFAIDDITIPETGYMTDVEQAPTYWQAHGFVQLGWQLPQQWLVQFIEDGPTPRATTLPLEESSNSGQWTIDIGKGGGTLVITPLTPFTDETATYWLQVE